MQYRLAEFQDAFASAVLAPEVAPAQLASLVQQPGFAVYRNTVMKGCIDALQANYPAVARLVGEEWFRAAATVFVRQHPPRAPMLVDYGDGFDRFLAAFPPATELDYLPGVASLDRLWSEAHVAADEALLEPQALAGMDVAEIGRARLAPHAAARWRWFADMPVYAIWSRNRENAEEIGDVEWVGEGALLTRNQDGAVRWAALGAGGCAFLDACANGATVADAAAAALAAEPALEFGGLIETLLAAGALAQIEPGDVSQSKGVNAQ